MKDAIEIRLLAALARGPMTAPMLCVRLGCDRGYSARVLRRLAEAGRVRVVADDGPSRVWARVA